MEEIKKILTWANDFGEGYEQMMFWADMAFIKIWNEMESMPVSTISDNEIESFVDDCEKLRHTVFKYTPLCGTLDDTNDGDAEDAVVAYIAFVTEKWQELTGEEI